jgi:flagellar biosynthesis GTPase FlhF
MEKEEFLKRAGIRTMHKDIVRLQEEEVLTERERISRLRTGEEVKRKEKRIEELKKEEEERKRAGEEVEMRKEIIRKTEEEERKKREEAEKIRKEKILEERREEREKAWQIEEEERRKLLERLRTGKVLKKEKETPEKAEEVLIPRPVLKRPSLFEKIFIRIIVLLILLGVFGLVFAFWYWFLEVKKAPPAPPPPVEEVIPEKPEVIIPPPLISVEATETLEISTKEEIPEMIKQILTKELKEGSFNRVLIKNISENKLISLSEFFEVFQIKTPENLYQKLGENYTLFIFSQEAGKRVGFIVEIKEKENLSDLLKSWESSMEKDFENLFALLGKEKPALSPYFKDGDYKGGSFRFQTFTLQDLGICYGIFNDYFLFTSSGESLTKAIDKLIK